MDRIIGAIKGAKCVAALTGAGVSTLCGIPDFRGAYKPDITFFGEPLPERAFTSSQELAIKADVMLVLGTSLTVFPAGGLFVSETGPHVDPPQAQGWDLLRDRVYGITRIAIWRRTS